MSLADLEANYAYSVERHRENPTAKHQLAEKQIIIDERRYLNKEPTRWYTFAQIEEIQDRDPDEWPKEPRMPLDLVDEFVEHPRLVKANGLRTLSVGALRQLLEQLDCDDSTPVWIRGNDYYGELIEVTDATVTAHGVILE